jgi:hypothetical protein
MAAGARATGADGQPEELRRRNVASQPDTAPVVADAPAKKEEIEKVKEKSKEKVL